jgi:hypothetical protein
MSYVGDFVCDGWMICYENVVDFDGGWDSRHCLSTGDDIVQIVTELNQMSTYVPIDNVCDVLIWFCWPDALSYC